MTDGIISTATHRTKFAGSCTQTHPGELGAPLATIKVFDLAESAAIENPTATLPVTASNERRLATFSEPLQVYAQFEQGIELVVIKEILGHAHIGVTATVYAHVRIRLQCDAVDLLGHAHCCP
ncbi:hypothetical protein ACIQVA_38770 [Streptomyces microflavus]|uniref:hypothetical protein n=1 Tax=Streptomyces microflavus TaxID=1919 RepID=UPI00382B1DA3